MKRTSNDFRDGKRRRRSGAVTVEAALVLPIVFLMFLGILEYGRFLLMKHVFSNAASVGAAYASKHTSQMVIDGVTYGATTTDVTNAVNKALAGQQLVNQTVNVYESDVTGTQNLGAYTNTGNGSYVCVQITGQYQFTVPVQFLQLQNGGVYTLTFQAVRRSEGN
jgi:Flp pilus assembly protein TadG